MDRFTRIAIPAILTLVMSGTAVPAWAQIDLTGLWVARQHEDWMERGPGPEAVDYSGIPINEEARARALAYSPSVQSLPERQCLYYQPHYVLIGPFGIRMWAETHPVTGETVAWKIGGVIDRAVLTIWMDGRPRPSPHAPHLFSGFITGKWRGRTLVATMTDMKEGFYRRNGVPSSDQTTVTLYITRHSETLTITGIYEDPVYLTEPYVISRSWQLDPTAQISPVPAPCVPEAEVAALRGDGVVPHVLPGENPFVGDLTRMYHIPTDAVLGGAKSMYPEYRKTMEDTFVLPGEACSRYCCGWDGRAAEDSGLECIGRP